MKSCNSNSFPRSHFMVVDLDFDPMKTDFIPKFYILPHSVSYSNANLDDDTMKPTNFWRQSIGSFYASRILDSTMLLIPHALYMNATPWQLLTMFGVGSGSVRGPF